MIQKITLGRQSRYLSFYASIIVSQGHARCLAIQIQELFQWPDPLAEDMGTDPAKGPFFKGFALLADGHAIHRALAIDFH